MELFNDLFPPRILLEIRVKTNIIGRNRIKIVTILVEALTHLILDTIYISGIAIRQNNILANLKNCFSLMSLGFGSSFCVQNNIGSAIPCHVITARTGNILTGKILIYHFTTLPTHQIKPTTTFLNHLYRTLTTNLKNYARISSGNIVVTRLF